MCKTPGQRPNGAQGLFLHEVTERSTVWHPFLGHTVSRTGIECFTGDSETKPQGRPVGKRELPVGELCKSARLELTKAFMRNRRHVSCWKLRVSGHWSRVDATMGNISIGFAERYCGGQWPRVEATPGMASG